MTAVDIAAQEALVIADDDVRYGPVELAATVALLQSHDLVRPQNYLDPLPWHARWDTARSLLNRSLDVVPNHVVHPGLLEGWGC